MTALAATSRAGWTAALGGSLLLHAGLAAALVPLLDESGRRPPPTEISFSEPPPDVIASLPQRSETLAAAPRASEPVEAVPVATAEPAAARVRTLSPLDPNEAPAVTVPAEILQAGPAAPALASAAAETLAGPASETLLASAPPEAVAQTPSVPAAEVLPAEAAAAVPPPDAGLPAPSAAALPALPPASAESPTSDQAVELKAQTGSSAIAPAEAAPAAPAVASATPAEQGLTVPALEASPPGTAAVLDAQLLASAALLPRSAREIASASAPAAAAIPLAALDSAAAAPAEAAAAIIPSGITETAVPLQPAGDVLQASPVEPGSNGSVALEGRPAEAASVVLAPSVQVSPVEAPALEAGASVLEPLPQAPETVASAAGAIPPAALEPVETDAERRAAQRRQAVAFVRDFRGGSDCFAVVPAQGDGGGVGFDAFSRNSADMRQFAEAALALGGDTRTTFGDLSAPQCSALVFARGQRNYPDFTLALQLDSDRIPDHSRLAGRISGAGPQTVRLLLIDDEGTVQSLTRFLSVEADPAFSIPMNLTAGQVRTKQLLVALTADRPLRMLEGETTEKAPVFFRQLQAEARIAGAKLDLGLRAFSVEAQIPGAAQAAGGKGR